MRPRQACRRSFTEISNTANPYAQVVKRLAPRKPSSLRGHRDHGVVGGLPADVLELCARDLGVEMPTAIGLAVRGAKQQIVQALQRQGAPGPCRSQAVEPGARFDVELIDLCRAPVPPTRQA